MSWLSTIGDFVTENKDIIKPILSTGLGVLQQSNKDNSQSQYLDYLRQREQQNYQDSVTAINAYNSQLGATNGGGGGGGGGGGAGAAAARATEANRMKASKKANKVSQNTYKDLLRMYAPYRQTADTLLPQMSQTYQNSLGLQNALGSYINSPEQVAKLNASVPAFQVNVPLPDSVRLK